MPAAPSSACSARASPFSSPDMTSERKTRLDTLAIASLLVAWAGAPVGKAYALLLEGGFGSTFSETSQITPSAHRLPMSASE